MKKYVMFNFGGLFIEIDRNNDNWSNQIANLFSQCKKSNIPIIEVCEYDSYHFGVAQ